jgi:hypothetical protein
MGKLIMAWSKCDIRIGKTIFDQSTGAESMASVLSSLGTINYQSTSMEVADGDELIARETGGKVVAREQNDGDVTITTKVIEPQTALYTLLFGTAAEADGGVKVSTHIVEDYYSLIVVPKNKGAIGVKAKKCSVSFKPGYSDTDGNYADITFTIVACQDGELYTRYVKSGAEISPNTLSFTSAADATGKTVTVTTNADDVTASSNQDWATVTVNGKVVTVKVSANTAAEAAERNAIVTITDSWGNVNTVTVTQAA